MNGQLIEGNLNIFGNEAIVDRFKKIEVHCPKVAAVSPYTKSKIQRAGILYSETVR